MTLTRLSVPALLLFASVSVGTSQNSIRLRFELYRNGTLVGNPEVTLTAGTAGRLEPDGVGTIAFTPTFREPESVRIAFDINSGGRHMTPVVVIGRNTPGSGSWSSTNRKDAFKFTVTWLP